MRVNELSAPLHTSEVATFFGPSSSPLLGVLHLPRDRRIRGGVIICGSLGQEGTNSVRLQRVLADGLAARGFGVLRFDYLGMGDSAYDPNRDDAVENWIRSIGHGLDYLTEIGAESIIAIALRAGCPILGAALTRSHSLNRVVYVDPVGTGRSYLREQSLQFKLSVGVDVDAADDGAVPILGAVLTAKAANEFRALNLESSPQGVNYLLVLRCGESDEQVAELARREEVRTVVVEGLTELAPGAGFTPMSLQAIDTAIGWIDAAESAVRNTATPHYVRSVEIPVEGSSEIRAVVESIENIGPRGLFAIRTQPPQSVAGKGKVVLFCPTSNDSHVGPMREWVGLSRKVAQCGAQALRWNRSGVGQSGPISRQNRRWVYSRQGVADVIAVAEHATKYPRDLHFVGVCSGAWYAANAARAVGAGSVLLVNMGYWNWRVVGRDRLQWYVNRQSENGQAFDVGVSTRPAVVSAAGFGKKITGSRGTLLRLAKRVRILRRLGSVPTVPEAILTPLAYAGTTTTVVLCQSDLDEFARAQGYTALRRLERTPAPPRLIPVRGGDHPAYAPAMLRAIRQSVMTAVASERNSRAGATDGPSG